MAKAGERIRVEDTQVALSPYLALASRASNQSIPHNATTTATFTTENLDTDGLYNPASPDKFSIQHSGVYLAHFDWILISNTCTVQLGMIYVNGAEVCRQEKADDELFYANGQSVDSGLLSLSAGDYVQAVVYQNDTASSARNLSRSRFSILYVSDGS